MRSFLLVIALLAACGRHAVEPLVPPQPGPTPIPVVSDKKVVVAVFGAPWCSACKETLPALNKELNKLPAAVRARVDFRLYLTTGSNSAVAPTQREADKYRDVLHLDASANIDPWKWTNFKKWVGGQYVIPAAAILSEDGTVLGKYPGGFNAAEVAYFVGKSL